MSTSVTYVPVDPSKVTTVQRIQLFSTPDRTGSAVVDAGPATINADLSWTFTFSTPADGFYYTIVTVLYTDGEVVNDSNDNLQVPAPPALQIGEEWVAAWELTDPDDPNAQDAAAAASRLMFGLSGRKFPGIRTITEQYVLQDWCAGVFGTYLSLTESTVGARISPSQLHNRYREWAWSGHPDGRYRYDYLRLKRRPVRAVLDVVWGPDYAESADPTTDYALKDRSIIEFYVGLRREVQVSYVYGTNPPAAGRLAARTLANELLLAINNSNQCRLPDRVTAVTRQGISYTVLDSQDFLEQGRTGLYEIDLFLKTVNPDNARKKSRVFSPDLPRARSINTQGTGYGGGGYGA